MFDFGDRPAEVAQLLVKLSIRKAQVIADEMKQATVELPTTGRKCVNCGKRIPERRIRAVPSACRCTKCQEIYELQQSRGFVL